MRRTKTTPVRSNGFPKMGLLLLLLACAIIFLPRTRLVSHWINPNSNPTALAVNDPEFPDSDLVVDAPANDLEIDKPIAQRTGPPEGSNLEGSNLEGSNLEGSNPETGKPESDLEDKARVANDAQSGLSALEDPQLKDWLSLIKDNTLSIHKREMPAYWRLLSMASKTDFESLNGTARQAPSFNDFHQAAPKHRGELVSMEINIRRVMRYDASPGNAADLKQLYEIWGWTNQSKSWLYVIVTPELPEGMTEGTLVDQKATFAGYFFKLQGYQSAMNKPTDRPYVAPLMIGRFRVHPSEKKVAGVLVVWPYVLVGTLAIMGVVGATAWKSMRGGGRRRKFSSDVVPTQPTETSFDWLEKEAVESKESP